MRQILARNGLRNFFSYSNLDLRYLSVGKSLWTKILTKEDPYLIPQIKDTAGSEAFSTT
jgi:hypothetical protein